MSETPRILFDERPSELRPGDLARAAACYCLTAAGSMALCASEQAHQQLPPPRNLWPLSLTWRPEGLRADLVAARDLIDRELETLPPEEPTR